MAEVVMTQKIITPTAIGEIYHPILSEKERRIRQRSLEITVANIAKRALEQGKNFPVFTEEEAEKIMSENNKRVSESKKHKIQYRIPYEDAEERPVYDRYHEVSKEEFEEYMKTYKPRRKKKK